MSFSNTLFLMSIVLCAPYMNEDVALGLGAVTCIVGFLIALKGD